MDSCINNHAPEHIDIRSDGSRVCLACANHYHARMRTYDKPSNPRKVTRGNDRSKHR